MAWAPGLIDALVLPSFGKKNGEEYDPIYVSNDPTIIPFLKTKKAKH